MNRATFSQRRQLKIIPLFIAGAFIIIMIRLFHLQIQSSYNLFIQSNRNCLRIEKINPPRGNILDCKGRLIATNRPMIQLVWKGSGNNKLDQEQLDAIQLLTQLFQENFIDEIALLKAERQGAPLILREEVTFEQLSYLLEQFPHHKNLTIRTGFKRYYPHIATACHILGYLSGISYEPHGKMGLEKIFDENLRGTPGQRQTMVNSIGRRLQEEEVQQALSGDNLQTTIDIELYEAATRSFDAAHNGAMLVMDAKTGAIRVMLSNPTFDPNMFLDELSPQQWHDLQEKKPFVNRTIAGCYPPASLFKLVVLVAALEENIVSTDSSWFCKGYIPFCGRHYHCKNRSGHGSLSMKEALTQSCNIPFYEIGKRIKIDTLAQYANMLGLGVQATTFLPEKRGLIPTAQWKRATYRKPWWPGETVLAAIGQGPIEVAPIQIARMINAICEGYLITPRILEAEPINKEPIAISNKTLQFMRSSMEQVIHHGTGQRLNRLKNFKIQGKTGTAQVRELTSLANDLHDEHAWFAAHITYKNNDPIVLVILVENVGASSFATEIARKFLIEYSQLLDQATEQQEIKTT